MITRAINWMLGRIFLEAFYPRFDLAPSPPWRNGAGSRHAGRAREPLSCSVVHTEIRPTECDGCSGVVVTYGLDCGAHLCWRCLPGHAHESGPTPSAPSSPPIGADGGGGPSRRMHAVWDSVGRRVVPLGVVPPEEC